MPKRKHLKRAPDVERAHLDGVEHGASLGEFIARTNIESENRSKVLTQGPDHLNDPVRAQKFLRKGDSIGAGIERQIRENSRQRILEERKRNKK